MNTFENRPIYQWYSCCSASGQPLRATVIVNKIQLPFCILSHAHYGTNALDTHLDSSESFRSGPPPPPFVLIITCLASSRLDCSHILQIYIAWLIISLSFDPGGLEHIPSSTSQLVIVMLTISCNTVVRKPKQILTTAWLIVSYVHSE